MHKYNNQDLAMMNAMLALRDTLAGDLLHELCNVNEDHQCHDAGYAGMRQALDSVCLVPAKATGTQASLSPFEATAHAIFAAAAPKASTAGAAAVP